MKTIASKKISSEMISVVLEKIKTLFVETNNDLNLEEEKGDDFFEIVSRCYGTKGRKLCLDDHYTSYGLMFISPTDWSIGGNSSGGGFHEMKVVDNTITVTHDGSRGSFPGLLMEIVYDNRQFFQSENGWKLETYITSEPTWAPVVGFLFGQFGKTGPSNQREADEIEALKVRTQIEQICSICDIPLPGDESDLYSSNPDDVRGCLRVITRGLTGIHYRRLSAMGVSI